MDTQLFHHRALRSYRYVALLVLPALFSLNYSSDSRVKQRTNLVTKHSSEYIYNSNGQILQVKNTTGNNISYEYFNNKIIKTSLLKGRTTIDTLFLNESGLTDEVHHNTSTGTASDIDKYTFVGGFNTKIENFWQGQLQSLTNTTILNENVTKLSTTMDMAGGKFLSSAYYYYYPNTKNTIDNENTGLGFMGRSSTNLVKQTILIQRDPNVTSHDTILFRYNYHFDEKGRVSVKASYGKAGTLIDSTGYTYY